MLSKTPTGFGGRGDRTEQIGLVTQHRQIRDRLATIGQHHREVDQHPGADHASNRALTKPAQCLPEGMGQTGDLGQIGQQPRPGMRGDTPPMSRHHDHGTRRCTLHLRSAFPLGSF